MYKPARLLSENRKTGCSIDLPIKGHCHPTPICIKHCYANKGTQAYPTSKKKQIFLSEYLKRKNVDELSLECMERTSVRLSGSGDLLPAHLNAIIRLAKACPETQFWGMTRKTDIATALNNILPNLHLLLTVDASSPKPVWNYQGKMCYGPRRAHDNVPDDPRIVTVFPYHASGRIIGNVPPHDKDCPAVRHHVIGCVICRRCWRW